MSMTINHSVLISDDLNKMTLHDLEKVIRVVGAVAPGGSKLWTPPYDGGTLYVQWQEKIGGQ